MLLVGWFCFTVGWFICYMAGYLVILPVGWLITSYFACWLINSLKFWYVAFLFFSLVYSWYIIWHFWAPCFWGHCFPFWFSTHKAPENFQHSDKKKIKLKINNYHQLFTITLQIETMAMKPIWSLVWESNSMCGALSCPVCTEGQWSELLISAPVHR